MEKEGANYCEAVVYGFCISRDRLYVLLIWKKSSVFFLCVCVSLSLTSKSDGLSLSPGSHVSDVIFSLHDTTFQSFCQGCRDKGLNASNHSPLKGICNNNAHTHMHTHMHARSAVLSAIWHHYVSFWTRITRRERLETLLIRLPMASLRERLINQLRRRTNAFTGEMK